MKVLKVNNDRYTHKFDKIAAQTMWSYLSEGEQEFVRQTATQYQFTQQELRIFCEYNLSRQRWKEQLLSELWQPEGLDEVADKQSLFKRLHGLQAGLNSKAKDYLAFTPADKPTTQKPQLKTAKSETLGLGRCPVASEKTRCCNLMTLDAVEKCGFDCSYCSIQSFYHGNEVSFDSDFGKKLANLKLDPNKTYHIGTGQSSDSLMWGNHAEILSALIDFAERNPNVILELKTKSKNIRYLLDHDFPKNIICTWSLNPQVIVDHEEHLTASLQERIAAARKIADKGHVVGFHFHPIVWYDGWADDYAEICQQLVAEFDADEVALVSLGTLTFTKSVMKTIRKRDFYSKILQMPMEEIAGKFSYPVELKQTLFKQVYDQLAPWHAKVFFYLCMEAKSLWQPVFGYEYGSNDMLEAAMKQAYFDKIALAQAGRR